MSLLVTLLLGRFEPPFSLLAAFLGVAVPCLSQLAAMFAVGALGCPQFCSSRSGSLPAPAQDCMSQQAWFSGERMSAPEVRVAGHPVSICNVKSGSVVTRSSDVMYTM